MKCIEVSVVLLLLQCLQIAGGCIFPAVPLQRPPTDAIDNAQASENKASPPLSSPQLWTCEIPDDCPENGACTYLWLGTSVCCSKPKTKKNKFPRNFRPLLNRIENDNSIVDYEAHEALAALQRAQHSKPRNLASGTTSVRSDKNKGGRGQLQAIPNGELVNAVEVTWTPDGAGQAPSEIPEEISPSDQFDKTISEVEGGSPSNDPIIEKSQNNVDDDIGSPQKAVESEQSKDSIRRFHAKDDKRFVGILHEKIVPKATAAFPTVSQHLVINRRTTKTAGFSRSFWKSTTILKSDATAKRSTRPSVPEFQKIDQSTRFQGFMEKIRKKPMFESRSFATPASTYFTKGTAHKTTLRKSPPNCGTNDRACEKTSRNRLNATVPLAPNLSHYQTSKPTTFTRNFRLLPAANS